MLSLMWEGNSYLLFLCLHPSQPPSWVLDSSSVVLARRRQKEANALLQNNEKKIYQLKENTTHVARVGVCEQKREEEVGGRRRA